MRFSRRRNVARCTLGRGPERLRMLLRDDDEATQREDSRTDEPIGAAEIRAGATMRRTRSDGCSPTRT